MEQLRTKKACKDYLKKYAGKRFVCRSSFFNFTFYETYFCDNKPVLEIQYTSTERKVFALNEDNIN